MTTCSRSDCTKTLRSNNTTGHCATNCQSPEAPASSRAKGVEGGKPKRSMSTATVAKLSDEKTGATMIRFRLVAEAVGRDPDVMIEEFAQAWLDGLRQTLES